jgi:hypothetical protein
MDSDTAINITLGAMFVAILISIYFAARRRRMRTKRLMMLEFLKEYFQGDLPADQLGQRIRAVVSRHFIHGVEFYSLAIAAFQARVDAKLPIQAHSKEDERKVLSLLAALKKEFALTDLNQNEAWRPGRE